MVDQWGVAHAPFAQARALLVEHGHKSINIMVHNEQGEADVVTAETLAPPPPGGKYLTHDDFGEGMEG